MINNNFVCKVISIQLVGSWQASILSISGFFAVRVVRVRKRNGAEGSRLTSALGLDFPEMPLSGTLTPLWGYIISHLVAGHIYAKERAFPLFILAFPVSKIVQVYAGRIKRNSLSLICHVVSYGAHNVAKIVNYFGKTPKKGKNVGFISKNDFERHETVIC